MHRVRVRTGNGLTRISPRRGSWMDHLVTARYSPVHPLPLVTARYHLVTARYCLPRARYRLPTQGPLPPRYLPRVRPPVSYRLPRARYCPVIVRYCLVTTAAAASAALASVGSSALETGNGSVFRPLQL